MPNRTDIARVVDPLLSTIARGYSNNEFIGEELFPIVEVEKEGGKIPLFGKEEFKVWKTERALGADSNEMEGPGINTTTYATTEHDIALRLDYRVIKESMLNAEARAVKTVANAIALRREVMYGELTQDLSKYGSPNKVTLTDDYFNEDAIDWIEYINGKKNELAALINKDANVAVIPRKVWNFLKFHPKLKSYITTNTDIYQAVPTVQKLQEILEIPKILIAGAKYTNDGSTFDFIWQNNIILAYITPPTGIDRDVQEPCFGYTLRVKGNPFSDTWEIQNGKVKMIRTTDNFGINIVGAESAYIINNPIDPAVYSPS